ncbi:MAG TPA: hypothetical protein GX007_03825 [Bacteroidales bacterium]|jgi:hypothetical protein|nr:hypothetical protein [Bacteroidales bacterium]
MKLIRLFLTIVIVSFFAASYAQQDTMILSQEKPVSLTKSQKKHSPTVAGYLSIIPGGGQIYNKKYWKPPIIYLGMGIATYFAVDFYKQTSYYKEEYIYRVNNDQPFLHPELETQHTDNVLAMRNLYRTRMEVAIAATAIIYALNIVDAVVDAHLFYFDVSDDLSMRITPSIQMNPFSTSISYVPSVGLKFKIK